MFGIILPGRPVITESTPISATQLTYAFPSLPSFSHIVVFMLPGTTIPEGQAASIYLRLVENGGEFKFLGALGNGKMSAFFRVKGFDNSTREGGSGGIERDMDDMVDDDDSSNNLINGSITSSSTITEQQTTITLGISLEPEAQVSAQLLNLQQPPSNNSISSIPNQNQNSIQNNKQKEDLTKQLASKIIQNAYNFLASYTGTISSPSPSSSSSASGSNNGIEVVPLKAFQEWWKKFEGKIMRDPGFLDRQD